MPNDYDDLLERALRQQNQARSNTRLKGKVEVGVGFLGGIAKSILSAPFRFPSNERLKKFVDNNKRESEYWYERQQPGYLPPGHPDRRD